ncbi:hypothetical protein [Mycobacteroides abscessus]|uniref:hypothetical protein n=1 Tax=Mycobacteroides abscessus TaxID=36809 RepID=UPI001781C382|nr:hypothetical protein [Mycobacteroides abscessus]MBE5459429.1 hypothetical protein [Mycobacteroides abscessus]QOF44124.1 hypothetical protein E3G69_003173 [Mycobacteroides abscessus]QOF48823.1 hypothetical protein E3G70_003172 [Mycobacteroides abscessus]
MTSWSIDTEAWHYTAAQLCECFTQLANNTQSAADTRAAAVRHLQNLKERSPGSTELPQLEQIIRKSTEDKLAAKIKGVADILTTTAKTIADIDKDHIGRIG